MLPRDKLLSPKEVCEKLGITRNTLWRWSRREGPAAKDDPSKRRMAGFPYPINMTDRIIRFKASEIEDWISANRAVSQ